MQSAFEAVAEELDDEKRAACEAVEAVAVAVEAAAAAVVAAECSRGPIDVPTVNATLSYHFDCCCSSSDGFDCCSYSCSRSLVRLSAPIVMKAH